MNKDAAIDLLHIALDIAFNEIKNMAKDNNIQCRPATMAIIEDALTLRAKTFDAE